MALFKFSYVAQKNCIHLSKESNHKSKYLESLTKIRNDLDKVKSSENTKNEIKRWLDDSMMEINQSNQ